MADYYTPTVVHPTFPYGDMTPLERLLLINIFESELQPDGLYLFAETYPDVAVSLPVEDVRAAIAASGGIESRAVELVREPRSEAPTEASFIEIDLDGTTWELIFQDIVRRSTTVRYVTVVTSFMCSKMRPDGFGGMAVLITPEAIRGKGTADILQEFLEEADIDPSRNTSPIASEDTP